MSFIIHHSSELLNARFFMQKMLEQHLEFVNVSIYKIYKVLVCVKNGNRSMRRKGKRQENDKIRDWSLITGRGGTTKREGVGGM